MRPQPFDSRSFSNGLKHLVSPHRAALSLDNGPLPATTLSYLSPRPQGGTCSAPFGRPKFTVRHHSLFGSSRAKPRDLQFAPPATTSRWKHHLPPCHPDRSGGTCGSTDLSWKYFSMEQLMKNAPVRQPHFIQPLPFPLSSRAKPRDLRCALRPSHIFSPPTPLPFVILSP